MSFILLRLIVERQISSNNEGSLPRMISLIRMGMAATLLCLCLLLACNFPVATVEPENLSAEALRQTLEALPTSAGPAAGATSSHLQTMASETVSPPVRDTLWSSVSTEQSARLTAPWPSYPLNPGPVYTYFARSGDTLVGLTGRFAVDPAEITSEQVLPETQYLIPGQVLLIPNRFEMVTSPQFLLPDSEVVYSPSSVDFDVDVYVQQAGGFLAEYGEIIDGKTLSGAVILQRVASEHSINPRLLLAFLEYRSGWVYGPLTDPEALLQPIGFGIPGRDGLYEELQVTATQLSLAYYGWRQGQFPMITYPDGTSLRANPVLNPGSVALQHLMAIFYRQEEWEKVLYWEGGFLDRYKQMFGDPWAREVDPLLPPDLAQPPIELPFLPGTYWALTAGPHFSWSYGSPRGALDFSPITGGAACDVSPAWATAAAAGLVVRSADNAVVLDLDGDGYEQTGWVLVYFHLTDSERIMAGRWVEADTPLGHPSCEGGRATGKHVHLARKYNGEWLAAEGPVPFVLGGWQAVGGAGNYAGSLVRGSQVVTAQPGGGQGSTIVRDGP